jgi:hypothetical protein
MTIFGGMKQEKTALVGDLAIDHHFKVEFRMLRVSRVDLDRGPTTNQKSINTHTAADGHQTAATHHL